MEAFVASADVEGAFDCIKQDDVERGLLQKGVHPESVCSLLRESCDLKGRINLLGAPMSPAILYARAARHGTCRMLGIGRNWLEACHGQS